MHEPIIRAQLRNWHFVGEKNISGFVYQDQKDVYDDGDHTILLNFKDFKECSTFYLFETNTGDVWRADKDEEVRRSVTR